MKAEDTVIIGASPNMSKEELLKAQAEISFKAGRESLLTELNSPSNLILAARQEGIREVVEWMETKKLIIAKSKGEYPFFHDYYDFEVLPSEWQSKLKEWGV